MTVVTLVLETRQLGRHLESDHLTNCPRNICNITTTTFQSCHGNAVHLMAAGDFLTDAYIAM